MAIYQSAQTVCTSTSSYTHLTCLASLCSTCEDGPLYENQAKIVEAFLDEDNRLLVHGSIDQGVLSLHFDRLHLSTSEMPRKVVFQAAPEYLQQYYITQIEVFAETCRGGNYEAFNLLR